MYLLDHWQRGWEGQCDGVLHKETMSLHDLPCIFLGLLTFAVWRPLPAPQMKLQ